MWMPRHIHTHTHRNPTKKTKLETIIYNAYIFSVSMLYHLQGFHTFCLFYLLFLHTNLSLPSFPPTSPISPPHTHLHCSSERVRPPPLGNKLSLSHHIVEAGPRPSPAMPRLSKVSLHREWTPSSQFMH